MFDVLQVGVELEIQVAGPGGEGHKIRAFVQNLEPQRRVERDRARHLRDAEGDGADGGDGPAHLKPVHPGPAVKVRSLVSATGPGMGPPPESGLGSPWMMTLSTSGTTVGWRCTSNR